MKKNQPRPKRGRPSKAEGRQRQDRFLDHCIAKFIEVGYRSVSVDDLANSFGVSKSTIYLKYGSKAGLVLAAMERAMPKVSEPLAKVAVDLQRPPREVLREFGLVIQSHSNDPSIRELWRAVSEARCDLDDLHIVQEETRSVLLPITTYLRHLKSRGLIDIEDEEEAALFFSELASGGLPRFLGEPIPVAERERALARAIKFFCQGIGLRI